ncbi:twin-arginine translocase TatA/TatE family subunit [Flavobacterium petrolei]|jgi:sec-independent protein translocase protein TatA|uniref:Twin-arginine translocase TatA/TatE family subunit n=1 Tax=Flavobacterium petrolei TaxID=2259594 RepID=A0A482TKI2_9FLAO|nr:MULTISPECIES: twin-arginine translocase TatA/TatE family subunit [Flavobacterium]MDD2675660.1 twin-arginine translocase TatA/TatE family subunit [Flavobacterium sp.]QIH38497.1 twin-arginine translocase TatA/TatE family subunit [Flavobacterium sp. Sr18]RYJ52781.1 twin-arginine translocase TatA/TatE family subunit [Flavobacterium petrolei]
MFGIGGGELIFIMFIVLMLFGSDKVPEIARTMGKAMAQLKNATNDIKSEIQKGAEANGFDAKTLTDFRGNITSEINKAKENLLGDTSQFTDITGNITSEINKAKDSLLADTTAPIETTKEVIEDITGPIKRQM